MPGALIEEWLVPGLDAARLRPAIAIAVLVAVAFVLIRNLRRTRAATDITQLELLLRAAALIAGCYLAVVLASRLYADPDIPFDWRLLSPVALLVETCLAAALVDCFRRWSVFARGASVLCVALWLAGSGWTLGKFVVDQPGGYGYEADEWQRSQLARWLRTEGARYALYSNDPTAIWHVSQRTSWLLPRSNDPNTLRRFAAALQRKPSVLLGFESPLMDTVPPPHLAGQLALRTLARFDKATIWVAGED